MAWSHWSVNKGNANRWGNSTTTVEVQCHMQSVYMHMHSTYMCTLTHMHAHIHTHMYTQCLFVIIRCKRIATLAVNVALFKCRP